MNIFLWILQVIVALYCVMGAAWRIANYEQAGQQIASVRALSAGMWNAIGAFEIICALCLILPGALRMKPIVTPIAATCLAVEMLLVTALHVHYFGWKPQVTNPAMWTVSLAAMAAIIAYGRFALKLT